MRLLYTFTISHFSEKARWALDYEGISYRDRRLIPGPHLPVVRAMGKKTTVPLLRDGRKVVQGSSAILDYIHDELGGRLLTPASDEERQRALEFERDQDHAFGLGVQRIFYATLLDHRSMVTDLWCQDGPRWSRAFYAIGYPAVARAVQRMYKTRPAKVEEAKERFRRTIRRVDEALERAPYLGGDAPSRLDITAAALLAPACRPPEHVVKWPEPVEPLTSFLAEFEGGPTWNHVLKMYAEHRRPEAQPQAS